MTISTFHGDEIKAKRNKNICDMWSEASFGESVDANMIAFHPVSKEGV